MNDLRNNAMTWAQSMNIRCLPYPSLEYRNPLMHIVLLLHLRDHDRDGGSLVASLRVPCTIPSRNPATNGVGYGTDY